MLSCTANVGIALDDAGWVAVDDHLRTNVDGVFAIGDLVPGPMLALKAEDEGVARISLLLLTDQQCRMSVPFFEI